MTKKITFPKFKRLKSNPKIKSLSKKFFNNAGRYLTLLLLTIAFTIIGFISLPLTESIFPTINFDLAEKSYSQKAYILELRIKTEDADQLNHKIRQTQRIISKRLYKSGAQQVSITGYHFDEARPDDDDFLYRYLQVKVKAPYSEDVIDQLVGARNYLRFYTAKEDVDFNDEENPYTPYLATNYNPTDLTRHDLRIIYLKPFKNDDGSTTYNAIFKEKFFRHKFKDFIISNAGKKIGIGIDGMIIPIDIPVEYSKEYRDAANISNFVFSLGLTEDQEQAEINDLLFNSGVIPLQYSVIEQNKLSIDNPNISHVRLALTFFTGIIAFAVFNILIGKKPIREVINNSAGLLLTFAVFVCYLKFFIVPVDLSLLYISSLLLVISAFINTLRSYDNNDYFITLGILLLGWIVSFGTIKELTFTLFSMMTLYIIVKEILKFYIINMKKFINND